MILGIGTRGAKRVKLLDLFVVMIKSHRNDAGVGIWAIYQRKEKKKKANEKPTYWPNRPATPYFLAFTPARLEQGGRSVACTAGIAAAAADRRHRSAAG